MKGQTKIIVFLILFFISIVLFTSTNLWGKGIVQQNIDLVKIEETEKFLKELDNAISNLIEYEGTRTVYYKVDSPVQLLGDNIIEIAFQSSVVFSDYWINVTSSDSSYIREKFQGNLLRAQLVYSPSEYRVEFFSNGPRTATPKYIFLAKNDTYTDNGKMVIKIEITFMK